MILSWWNMISPWHFWFHQDSVHFTKFEPISPSKNRDSHQDGLTHGSLFIYMIRQNSFSDIRLYFLIRDTEGYGGSYLTNNLMLYGTNPFFLNWLSRKRLMWTEPFLFLISNLSKFMIFKVSFSHYVVQITFFLFSICFDIAFVSLFRWVEFWRVAKISY